MVETEERIDYQKLKDQERIAFFDEVILFEDELADNGAAVFSVKIVRTASNLDIWSFIVTTSNCPNIIVQWKL